MHFRTFFVKSGPMSAGRGGLERFRGIQIYECDVLWTSAGSGRFLPNLADVGCLSFSSPWFMDVSLFADFVSHIAQVRLLVSFCQPVVFMQ